jgi:hypothetical protein
LCWGGSSLLGTLTSASILCYEKGRKIKTTRRVKFQAIISYPYNFAIFSIMLSIPVKFQWTNWCRVRVVYGNHEHSEQFCYE